MSENASLLVCDDIRMEANGKLFVIGMYTGNLVVPADGVSVPQLSFLFYYDCIISDVPKKIGFELQFPGDLEPTVSSPDFVAPELSPQHTRWYVRHLITRPMPTLKLGKIIAHVVADERRIGISTPWIELAMAPSVGEHFEAQL